MTKFNLIVIDSIYLLSIDRYHLFVSNTNVNTIFEENSQTKLEDSRIRVALRELVAKINYNFVSQLKVYNIIRKNLKF